MKNLTQEQRWAVHAEGVSVALESGAGCGKTHVLTSRYLWHLRAGSDVAQVVAITFTERAAREMRDRVRKAVSAELAAEPSDDGRRRWRGHLRNLEQAPVTTIHAFCGNLLRQYAVEADVGPGAEILEEALASPLRSEARADALRRLLTDDSPAGEGLRELIVLYGWQAVLDGVRHLLTQADLPAWEAWLARPADDIADDWLSRRRPTVLPDWCRYAAAAVPGIVNAVSLLRRAECVGPQTRPRVAGLLDGVAGLAAASPLIDEIDRLKELAKVGPEKGKAWPDDATYEAVKAALADFRKALPAAAEAFTSPGDDYAEAAAWGHRWVRVAAEVARAYQARKRQLGVLDFNDLLALTDRLLDERPEVRDALRQRYHAVLVDEFQDTDPLQVRLVERLCGVALRHGKLFAVGDPKQSIYRFRGADVSLFRSVRDRLPDDGRLGLSLNFRSRPGVLDFVNVLFQGQFEGYQPLRASREESPHRNVEFLWSLPPGGGTKETAAQIRKREAAAIADRLDRLREHHKLGDMAILFRSMSHAAVYEDALSHRGLDYYLVGGRAFFAQQEIYDLLHLLRALENPLDGVSLFGTLRSPFCCLSDESLILLGRHPDGLWAGLNDAECQRSLPADRRPAADRALRSLTRWRSQKDRLPIARLLGLAFAESGYDAALLFEPLGERKVANLWKLQDMARAFDRAGPFGLAEFIDRLGEMVRSQPPEEQAATLPESADVVRLMSVHQAKGLEFPVVVVPDVNAASRGGPLPAADWDRDMGCAARPPSDEPEPPFSDAAWKLRSAAAGAADWQEDLRILYVACTRAEERLILSAGLPDGAYRDPPLPWRLAGPWALALSDAFDLLSGERLGEKPSTSVRVEFAGPSNG